MSARIDPDLAMKVRLCATDAEGQALILSAAAKMVKQTGAVEALKRSGEVLRENRISADIIRCDTKGRLYQTNLDCGFIVKRTEEVEPLAEAALQSLRALTEHKP